MLTFVENIAFLSTCALESSAVPVTRILSSLIPSFHLWLHLRDSCGNGNVPSRLSDLTPRLIYNAHCTADPSPRDAEATAVRDDLPNHHGIPS